MFKDKQGAGLININSWCGKGFLDIKKSQIHFMNWDFDEVSSGFEPL